MRSFRPTAAAECGVQKYVLKVCSTSASTTVYGAAKLTPRTVSVATGAVQKRMYMYIITAT